MRLIILSLVLALVGCTTTSNSQPESTVEIENTDRKLADIALETGRVQNAIDIYSAELEKNPSDPELHFLLGSAYNQVDEFELAIHYLQRVGNSFQPEKISRELGRAHLGLGELDLAQQELMKALEVQPKDAVSQNSLGVCYSLQRKYDAARDAFSAALAIEPTRLEYRNNLALAWILDDQPQKGIDVLYRAYSKGKSTAKMRQNLALAYAMKGDLNAARELIEGDLTAAELESNLEYYRQVVSKPL